jgi:hypothetical protein
LIPLAALPVEVQQAIAVYALVGMVVCLALAVNEIDKAAKGRAAPAPAVAQARPAFAWLHCPNGHCKALANRDWSCPTCGAQLQAIPCRVHGCVICDTDPLRIAQEAT